MSRSVRSAYVTQTCDSHVRLSSKRLCTVSFFYDRVFGLDVEEEGGEVAVGPLQRTRSRRRWAPCFTSCR